MIDHIKKQEEHHRTKRFLKNTPHFLKCTVLSTNRSICLPKVDAVPTELNNFLAIFLLLIFHAYDINTLRKYCRLKSPSDDVSIENDII